jgi:hypothetical protein
MAACVGLASPATAQMYDPGRRPSIEPAVQALAATSVIIPGNLLQNPSFELNGGGNSTTFSNWTIFNINLSDGSFFVQSGTTVAGAPPPSGSGATVPAPTDGNFAAMSNQDGPGLRIIYQDVAIPAGGATLSCDVFINSETTDYVVPNPETLSPFGSSNEHARIDVMNPAAPVDDVGSGVLQNIFFTNPGDAGTLSNPMSAYAKVSAVIPFGGRTVRIRFAEVDNQLYLNMGVDNCSLVGRTSAPAMSIAGLLVLTVMLVLVGCGLTLRHRQQA